MDTNKLRAFKILVETENLRKAADLLNMSHAGLFKCIKSLENELGVKLTTKDGRNIKITSEGGILYKGIDGVLSSEQTLLANLKSQSSTLQTKIRIGTFEVFSTYLAPKIIESLGEEYAVDFQEMGPGQIEEAIASGHIDVGISYLAIPRKGVDHLKVGTIDMGVFTASHPDFDTNKISDFPFVVPSAPVLGTPTRVQGLDGWPDNQVERHIAFRVQLMETAINLLRAGKAAAFLPRFIVELHNQIVQPKYHLKSWPLPKGVDGDQPIFLIKARNAEETKILKRIARLLRSIK